MNVAIIPARGGSKRIPRKNIKDFLGQPIIAYSIRTALDSGLFDKVIVSTDDEEIAEVAKKYGAEVPFLRPKELSGDFVGTSDVVKHAINWCLDKGLNVDYVCCIYATAPSILTESLRQGLESLINSGKLFAFGVASFAFPIQRALRINNGEISMFQPEHFLSRSQDLEEAYHDAGQFCWGRPQAFLDDVAVFSYNSAPVIIPRHLVQDIDTMEDWKRAELMYKSFIN